MWIVPLSNFAPRGFGFVHHIQGTIFYHQVPSPNLTIRNFCIAAPQCQLVCDGGTLAAGRSGSTVVDLTATGRFHIRRAGTAQRATVEVLRAFGLEGQPAAETE